jgi:2'-5' RNA ligase
MHTYSLWLRPAAAAAARFAELIDTWARCLGTPRFEPHITFGTITATTDAEATARARQLAARLAPVPIHLVGAGHTDAYFRCLYLRAEKTPQLLAAYRLACAELEQPMAADFMPHVSLVYGTLATSVKEKIIAEIDGNFPEDFFADSVSLCVLAVSPDDWRSLGPFSLTGRTA